MYFNVSYVCDNMKRYFFFFKYLQFLHIVYLGVKDI